MATPVNADLIFVGASGKSYSINMYTADTAAYINKFSAHTIAAATSATYWRSPEPVTLVDLAIKTGMTQTHLVMTQDGAVKNGTVMGVVPHVTTAATRPRLAITFPAGTLVGCNTI